MSQNYRDAIQQFKAKTNQLTCDVIDLQKRIYPTDEDAWNHVVDHLLQAYSGLRDLNKGLTEEQAQIKV